MTTSCVVVGGGPVGLTAAVALQQQGIDFVLLERRPDIVLEEGAVLVLMPVGLRALAQLGLEEAINAVSSPLSKVKRYDHAGTDIADVNWFDTMKARLGKAPRVITRRNLTRVLRDSLRPEAKVHCSKTVENVISSKEGVAVTCSDGTSYSGSMVLGADGAYSKVRSVMQKLASNTAKAQPWSTTYRSLWIRFPHMAGLKPGDSFECHGEGASTQLFATSEAAVVALYETLDTPSTGRARYTEEDQTRVVERWGSMRLTPELTLHDVYKARHQAGLVELEEGVLNQWSHDRIVLLGDAAHKSTPSTAAGYNNGILDVAALVKELAGGDPQQDLQRVFRAYQKQRLASVKLAVGLSGLITAITNWSNTMYRFFDQRIMAIHTIQSVMVTPLVWEMYQAPAFKVASGMQ